MSETGTSAKTRRGCIFTTAKSAAAVGTWRERLSPGVLTETFSGGDVLEACRKFCHGNNISSLILINAAGAPLPKAVLDEAFDDHESEGFDLTIFDPFYFPDRPPVIYSARFIERLPQSGRRMNSESVLDPNVKELGDLWANVYEPDLKLAKTIPGLESRLRNIDLYPYMISLSPTEFCNYRCPICHVHSADLGKDEYNKYYSFFRDPASFKLGFMDIRKYDRLLEEAVAFKGVSSLFLGGSGEPTLHNEFITMVEHAAGKGLSVSTTSNGVLLKPDQVRRMFGAGLRYLDISIDAATEETYKRLRGGDLKRLEEIIMLAADAGRGCGSLVSVNLTVQKENESEVGPFIEKWIDAVDFVGVWGCHLLKKYVSGWNWRPNKQTLCKQLYTGMAVSTDGHVWSCCGGGPIEGCIGMWDGSRTLRDLWTDPRWQSVKKKYFDGVLGEIPMCLGCEAWMLDCMTRIKIEGGRMAELRPATAILRKIRPDTKLDKLSRFIRIGLANPAQSRSKVRAVLRTKRMKRS